jgi:hypothetical protein
MQFKLDFYFTCWSSKYQVNVWEKVFLKHAIFHKNYHIPTVPVLLCSKNSCWIICITYLWKGSIECIVMRGVLKGLYCKIQSVNFHFSRTLFFLSSSPSGFFTCSLVLQFYDRCSMLTRDASGDTIFVNMVFIE